MCFNDSFYVQKDCIGIGSSVALGLCDIYLAYIDERIDAKIANFFVFRIFRYVEDYLVLLSLTDSNLYVGVADVTNTFLSEPYGLHLGGASGEFDSILQYPLKVRKGALWSNWTLLQ